MDLSVVATIYNDEGNVAPLVAEIQKHVNTLGVSYEILLVDDFSKDGSRKAIENVCEQNPEVKGVFLSKNHGQQIAMSAGINLATGNYVVIMDGDLQNPPAEIPNLYNEIKKGYDIVYTTSEIRNNFFDQLTSKAFWFLVTTVFKVDIVPNQLMLKIMTRDFVDKFNKYNELNRTIEGLLRDISSNYSIIKVTNRKRLSGKSHYNLFMKISLMIDLIISLTAKPLDLLLLISGIIFTSSFFLGIYYLIMYLFFATPIGYTSLVLAIVFFGSFNSIMIGLVGKYISTIYLESKNRPLFHLDKTINIHNK